ncbi:MAG: hypothetical protein SFZ02_20255 [bacterium]|nr:hypothetical protein [bacterium]
MATKRKNIQVRIDERSNKLLNMLKGELQLKNPSANISIPDAINILFDTCRPDLVQMLNQIDKGQ